MKKSFAKRILPLMLVMAMMLSGIPPFGATVMALGASGQDVCTAHTEHDEACGYTEAVEGADCTFKHTHDDDCSYDGQDEESCNYDPASHEHDVDCGYIEAVEGTPCAHSCDLCVEETEDDEAPAAVTGTITEFVFPDAVQVAIGTPESDVSFPATVTANVRADGEDAQPATVTVGAGAWNIWFGTYTPGEESMCIYEADRASLMLPDGVTLPDDVELPLVRVEVGEYAVAIEPMSGGTWGGTGIDADPYTIDDQADLALLASNVNNGNDYSGKYFQLTADITLTGSWTAIGTSGEFTTFKGIFDGDGKTISGLSISTAANYQGLFGYIGASGIVKNLGVSGNISGGMAVGGIAGQNSGTIENCYFTGSVSGTRAGGIAGWNQGTIENCYNTGTISGGDNVGGIAGMSTQPITNCYSNGSVSGAGYVGGILGRGTNATSEVQGCVSLGIKVTGTSNVGRVIGGSHASAVISNYARADLLVGASGSEMVVTSGTGENTIHGADVALNTALSNVFSGWNGSVWDIPASNLVENGALPTLQAVLHSPAPTLPLIFKAVTNITDVPTTATAGTDLTLTGTVAPSDATNQTIAWSVTDAGTTGASITGGGSTLSTTAAGTVTVTATITNGATASTDYTQDFTITVNAATPSITIGTQPQNANVTRGEINGSLSVTASASNSATVSYRWYACEDTSKTNPQSISSATSASYAIPTNLALGTYYYYCKLSAAGCADMETDVATVKVGGKMYRESDLTIGTIMLQGDTIFILGGDRKFYLCSAFTSISEHTLDTRITPNPEDAGAGAYTLRNEWPRWKVVGIDGTKYYLLGMNAEPATFALTVNSGTGDGDYASGTVVTITADPAPSGQVFDKWTGGNGGSFANAGSATTTFAMPANTATVTATYKSSGGDPGTTYHAISVSANPSAGGSVSGGGSIASGNGHTVTATASSNYRFTNWTEGGSVVSTSASYSFTVSGNRTLVANFTYTGSTGGDDNDNSGSDRPDTSTPTKPTIEVSEVSVSALKGLEKYVTATANVENAFSRSVEVRLTDDKAATETFTALLGSDNGRILAFDISLYVKGTGQKTQPKDGYAVTINIPLPQDLWDVREDIQIGHIVDGKVVVLSSKLVWENEMWNIIFEADSFSPYALLVGVTIPQQEDDNANHNPSTGGYPDDASVEVPQTGDPGVHPLWWLWVLIPAFVLAISLGVVVWRRRQAEG